MKGGTTLSPNMGTLSPSPWDLSPSCQDSWAARASFARPHGIPAAESALGSHPCVALSSVQVGSVYQGEMLFARLLQPGLAFAPSIAPYSV